jgi:hypothetical protein
VKSKVEVRESYIVLVSWSVGISLVGVLVCLGRRQFMNSHYYQHKAFFDYEASYLYTIKNT